jgi:hypothetical protein
MPPPAAGIIGSKRTYSAGHLDGSLNGAGPPKRQMSPIPATPLSRQGSSLYAPAIASKTPKIGNDPQKTAERQVMLLRKRMCEHSTEDNRAFQVTFKELLVRMLYHRATALPCGPLPCNRDVLAPGACAYCVGDMLKCEEVLRRQQMQNGGKRRKGRLRPKRKSLKPTRSCISLPRLIMCAAFMCFAACYFLSCAPAVCVLWFPCMLSIDHLGRPGTTTCKKESRLSVRGTACTVVRGTRLLICWRWV